MGTTRIALFLTLGARLLAVADTTADLAAPRPQAEASATVTVTAEAVPVETTQTPNPVTVIGPDVLDTTSAVSLGDLLQDQLPGQVLRNGGVGSASAIYLGDNRSRDTVVTLDGLRLTDSTGLGGVNTDVVGLLGIDRVEIQQGPCSTRFGSDAMGGAVALYSAGGAPEGTTGELRGAVGTAGILRGTVKGAFGWDAGWVRAGVTSQREDQVLDPANRYRSTASFLGLGRQLGADTLFTANYFNTYSAVPIPITSATAGTQPRTAADYDLNRQDYNRIQVLDGTVRSELAPTLTGELTVGQVLQDRLEPNWLAGAPMQAYSSRRNQAVGHITWQPSEAGSVTLGLDLSEENARVPDPNGADSQATGSARHLAALLEGQHDLGAGLRATGSVRLERDRQSVPGGESSTDQSTGKLGLNWTLPAGFRAFASVGTGFSNPLLYSAMYNFENGGSALANEKSRSVQAGVDYGSGPWKAGLVLSRTRFSSLVYFDLGSYLYQNGSSVRIQSAELKGGYETARWGLTGFYRNQEARDLDAAAGQQLTSSAVLARPFQSLGARAYVVLGQVRLDGRWSWMGPRYVYTGSSTGTAFHQHYNDLNLAATWAARKNLDVVLRGDNLMQPRTSLADWTSRARDYQNDASQAFGYPAQPPTGTLEVRYRF